MKPNPERNEVILDMWAARKSAMDIAMLLADGTTRNAVIGVVGRARDNGDARADLRPLKSGKVRPPRPPKAPRRKLYKPRVPKMSIIKVVQPPPIIDEPEPEGIEHNEARPGQCKWFLRGQSGKSGKVCGCKVVSGKSWCPSHYRHAFVPRRAMVAA